MKIERRWAFFRRLQYGLGFGAVWLVIFVLVYLSNFYTPPNCFDNRQNGDERGVDCGGPCSSVCAFDVQKPTVQWARSFRVTENQYNAVAYIVNKNRFAGSPALPYTISLYDSNGLITQRSGTTILPPDSVYPVFEARIDTKGRVPTQTIMTVGETDNWVQATGGRNQFTVQSRTLTGADSSPRLEAQIYNNMLTEAKEVEVVATIFDMQGNALTSSRTFIDNFAGQSSRTAVFTWPEPIAKTIRSCEVPTDVVLAIDVSGSMNNDGGNPPQPITSVLQAAGAFAQRMRDGDQAALLTFATQAVMLEPLTGNIAQVAREIAEISIDPAEERGTTNTGDALYTGMRELLSPRHNSEARKVMVLLTDGLATAPGENPESYALQAAQQVKQNDISLFTIGLGTQVNMEFITNLASSPKQAYRAVSSSQVDSIYRTITSEICEDGPAVIEIIPKTDAGFSAP